MKPHRKQKLILVALLVFGIGGAAALVLNAFTENLMFFFSPTQVAANQVLTDRNFRLGGLVVPGSVSREDDGLTVHFTLTDNNKTVPVVYTGILPDLFREGQGIVSMGKLGSDGVFKAEEVLAKHDENYMPPEVAEALQAAHRENAAAPNEGGL